MEIQHGTEFSGWFAELESRVTPVAITDMGNFKRWEMSGGMTME
jgi:hypothetical protein